MEEPLWGLAVSGLLYLVGSLMWVATARSWWARQPEDLHPELEAARQEARSWRPSSLFRRPETRSLAWLAGGVLLFALFWALDFGLLFAVLYVAMVSLWWNSQTIQDLRAESRETRERLGLEPAAVGRLHLTALYGAGMMITAGTLGAACFLGGLVVAALD